MSLPRMFALIVALWFFAPRTLYGQTSAGGIALNQFEPAPAGDRFLSVPSPYVEGHLVLRGMAVFDYAHKPLVVSDGTNSGAIVGAQVFSQIGVSLSLWDRMLAYANFPIALFQSGDSPMIGGVAFPSPEGVQVGDLRLGARFRVVGNDEEPFQLGIGASMYLPTAPNMSFTGDGGFRLAPELIAGGVYSRFIWSAAIRPVFRTSSNPATFNHGAGLGLLFLDNRLQIGVDYMASTPLQDGVLQLSEGKTIQRGLLSNVEVHVDVRGRIVSGLWAGVAGGPGLLDALGTPQFRVMGMVGWLGAPKEGAP